tara:strand:- start:198 stop:458 length:261 start_codon:yes stop_codon:yes gene_type:complete
MANTLQEKQRYVKEYIRSLAAIEEAMEPYKEQRRELRTEFRENGWLHTDEIRAAVKAYRLFKGKFNIDEIVDNYNLLNGNNTAGGK